MSRTRKSAVLMPLVPITFLLVGCVTATPHLKDVRSDESDNLTVGKVQREIKLGMSSAEVIEALGSPNIVATDGQRREVWTYDKVATETVYSRSEGGVSVLVLGGYRYVGGGGGAGYSRSAGAASTSQRTLTIIIKFDNDGTVRDFAYRSSQF